VDFWADFQQRIITGGINEWQNLTTVRLHKCRKTERVVAFHTAKHFIIPIETLFV